jgi:hypothetical protein
MKKLDDSLVRVVLGCPKYQCSFRPTMDFFL